MTDRNLGWKTILMAGFLAALVVGATPTLAGFQFKAAPAPSAASFPPPLPPVSAAPLAPPPRTEEGIIWGENGPQMPAQKAPGVEALPLTASERTSRPPRSPDIVSGFGADVPLRVALQQVVPQQYKLSLGPGVNSARHVSWRGDRPWQQVLTDMLSSLRLSYVIKGDTVVVNRIGSGETPAYLLASSSRKADMIPEDMLSGSAKGKPEPPPEAMMPQHMPSPVQETEVMPLRATPVLPPPAEEAAPVQHSTPMVVPHSAPLLPAPLPAATPSETPWHAQKGQTLKEVLKNWSAVAHVNLYWVTDYDYKLNTDIAYSGNYEQAIAQLFNQFSTVQPQPYGQLHRNPQAGGTLVVNTY